MTIIIKSFPITVHALKLYNESCALAIRTLSLANITTTSPWR